MDGVINYMEIWVDEYMKKLCAGADFCTCDNCMRDIYALALNNLPPFYISTTKGKILAKYKVRYTQFETDIIIAVSNAIDIVKNNPNHDDR